MSKAKRRVKKPASQSQVVPERKIERAGIRDYDRFLTYEPLREELHVLVAFWVRQATDVAYVEFLSGCTGGSEMRRRQISWERIAMIGDLIGERETIEIVERTVEAMAKEGDPLLWDIFLHGTEMEQDMVTAETNRRMTTQFRLMDLREKRGRKGNRRRQDPPF